MQKSILSNLSKKPPCPGSKLLESLTSNERFKSDSTKSPNVANKTIIIEAPIHSMMVNSGTRNSAITIENKTVETNPPTKPSTDFLGEIRGNNLRFPISIPQIYAKVSFAQTRINIDKTRFAFMLFATVVECARNGNKENGSAI